MPIAKLNARHSARAIENLAQKVRGLPAFQTGTDIRDKLNALVAKWGGTIQVATPEGNWESLRIAADRSFIIFLSPETSAVRDNFTIAHELGHLLLHTDFEAEGAITFNRFGSNRAETEANWFAANLLMPKDDFKTVAKKLGNDPFALAGYFGVSVAAAKVRLTALSLA